MRVGIQWGSGWGFSYPTQTLTPVVVCSPELTSTRGFVRTVRPVPVCACSCVHQPPPQRLNFNITLTQAACRLHRLHRFVCHSFHRPPLPLPRSTPHPFPSSPLLSRIKSPGAEGSWITDPHRLYQSNNNVHDTSPVEPSFGAASRWRPRTLDLVSPFPLSYVFTILFT